MRCRIMELTAVVTHRSIFQHRAPWTPYPLLSVLSRLGTPTRIPMWVTHFQFLGLGLLHGHKAQILTLSWPVPQRTRPRGRNLKLFSLVFPLLYPCLP